MGAVPRPQPVASNVCGDAVIRLPMITPLYPDACPCGKAPRVNGFCDEHAGAVAFKLPIAADGTVLPAVDWQWPHEQPCPLGEAWRTDSSASSAWACSHREHEAVLVQPASPQAGEEAAVGDPLVLTLSGEIDIDVADRLVAPWYSVAEHAEHEIIEIDLHEVTFMSAAGLGLLMGMRKRQERHGGQLHLRRPPALVTRLLQLTGSQGGFPVADELLDATIAHPIPG
jgi:anti-anti-sigma factor